MPPFDGPRAMLWVTRYPLKTCVLPSSIPTGMETSTDFLHTPSTATRFGSMSNASATRRSWLRAISNGFSRRWVAPASTAVTVRSLSERSEAPRIRVYDRSSELEREAATAGRAAVRRIGDDGCRVMTGAERPPCGACAGEPERIAAGQRVPDPVEDAERLARRGREEDVQARERLDAMQSGDGRHPACIDGEREGTLHERRADDRVDGHGRERKRPWDANGPAAGNGDDDRTVGRSVADRLRSGHRDDVHEDAVAGGQLDVPRTECEVDGGGAFVLRPDGDVGANRARRDVGERERRAHLATGRIRPSERERRRRRGQLSGGGSGCVDLACALRGDGIARELPRGA